jgi:hypothetical protein
VHPRVVTQVVTSNHTSQQRWAPEPSRVPRPGPHLLAEVSSGAATWPVAPGLASLLICALTLPHVPQLRTSPPCRGGLRRCHVSHGSGLCLSERRASALPRVPQLQASPPCRGGLRRCHVARPRLTERRAPVLSRTPRPPVDCGPQE